jgi:threonine dehydratase
MSVTLADILAARQRIAGHVRRTPLDVSTALSAHLGADIRLKHEHRQITGGFKLRGATNAVRALKPTGVVAVSTGNHGRAVAHAARAAGIPAIVCISTLAPENKVAGIRSLGAEARVTGASQDEAQLEADRLAAEGLTMLPPFDHPLIIAGQGTCGLEIMEDAPDAQTVLVPLSGGGLIAGVALAVKAVNPRARIVGISMERGAAMAASLAAGHPVQVAEEPTLADSLGGGIGLGNAHSFGLVRDLVDEVVLLTEAEIAEGVRWAYLREQEVLEGGGAVAIAALLCGKVRAQGPTVCLLSGRNIAMETHRRLICEA